MINIINKKPINNINNNINNKKKINETNKMLNETLKIINNYKKQFLENKL